MKIMLVGGEDDGRVVEVPESPPLQYVVSKSVPTFALWLQDEEPVTFDPLIERVPYVLCRRVDGTVAYVLASRVYQLTDWAPNRR